MQAKRGVLVTVIVMMAISGTVFAEGLDVTVRAPTIIFNDTAFPTTQLQDELNILKDQLETDPDLQNFANQEDLARAFANAGAASTHMATQRSFSDYRAFALVLGTGAAIAAPSPSAAALEDSMTDFENDGDAYFGAAIQPLTVSLGVNLSRWVDRLRVNAKFGYFNVAEGTVVDNISFRSTTIGVGADYQIIESRSLPLGIIRWRGVSLGSGINYQSNTTDLSVEVRDAAFSEETTFDDLGLTPPAALTALGYEVSPTVNTKFLTV
ncbi:MAG: hypothetical protein PF508_08610 [Spirochaeta sp.]|jgi:hypothetical protein|nr:hypothetical protein [Spirochaeta sp.]